MKVFTCMWMCGYMCVFVWPWMRHLWIQGLKKSSLALTHPKKEQRALCVFPSEQKHTPKNQATLSWSHSNHCGSKIKLWYQKEKPESLPFPSVVLTVTVRVLFPPNTDKYHSSEHVIHCVICICYSDRKITSECLWLYLSSSSLFSELTVRGDQ